ncbi:MAG: hypothetical protein RL255_288 [Actinomycetota bacterium]
MLSKLRAICEAIEFGAEPDEVLKVIAMQITHSSKGGRFLSKLRTQVKEADF